MKKVLFLVPHLSTGGMPQYTYDLMRKIKDSVEIYCIEYNMVSWDFIVQRNKIISLLGERFFCLGEDKQELFQLIEQINPDIIHLQEMPEYFLSNEIADKLYANDRNYLIVETSHDSSFNSSFKRYFSDHLALISQYQLREFSKLGIPIDLIEADIEYKERQDRTIGLNKLGLDPNLKHVLNVGLFTPRKNQAEAIEYARSLQDYPIQFHFVGNQADNFAEYWKPLLNNLPSNVKIWGERADVDNFYSCMDLMLFTSRGTGNDKETSPLVIRESIGYNLPALIYNLPVYLGMYDKYETITYLNDDIKSNEKLLLNKLGMNNKPKISMEETKTKKAVIIDAYITSIDKEQLLEDCIKTAKALGDDIILVSHCSIPQHILSEVDYHIFDKDNSFNDNHVYAYKRKENVEVRININKSHEFPIIRSMRAAISFAKSLGYEFFYFTEFDHKYSDDDIKRIKGLEKQMVQEDKDFIFFQPIDAIFGEIKGVYYESCFFGAKTDKFLDIFNSYFPQTLEEYNEKFVPRFPNCLEHFFYEAFHPQLDKTVLIQNYVKLYLESSEINISSYQNIKIMILQSESGRDYLYIANENTSPYTFRIFFDDVFQKEITMKNAFLQGEFEYFPLKKDCLISIYFISGDNEDLWPYPEIQKIQYSHANRDDYAKNGVILFKNEPSNELFSTELDYDTNKITFTANTDITTETLVSFKDIDSRACIYSFTFPPCTTGTSFWSIPKPINFYSFKNDINFGGIVIEYFQNGNLVESKEIRIKEIPSYKPKMELTNTEPIYDNYYEFFVQKIYDELDIDGCPVVIDAGANIGLWTKYILTRNAKKVYCFEPNHRALDNLNANLKEHTNVKIIPKAIGTEDGVISFYEDKNSLVSSIYPTGESIKTEVDCISFNTFMSENKLEKIDLFKMDIEGGEFPIIRSFGKEQFDKIDAFLIEHHEWNGGTKEELVEKLNQFGYNIEEVGDYKFIFAYKQKKSYVIPPSVHERFSQKNVNYSRVNLYESSKGFNWDGFNSGRYFIFDHMYNEMYREYEYNDTGCSYERRGCILKKNDIVVDIGANIGMFSNLAYERGASKIFSFEPTDIAYECLLRNKPRNCETFKMAISDNEELVEIISNREMDPMGASLYSTKKENSVSTHVYSTTLDKLFEQKLFDKIDFLKIDTEGAELAILNGLSDENLKKVDRISMEFHYNQLGEEASKTIWERLQRNGFQGFNLIYGDGALRMYNFWRE